MLLRRFPCVRPVFVCDIVHLHSRVLNTVIAEVGAPGSCTFKRDITRLAVCRSSAVKVRMQVGLRQCARLVAELNEMGMLYS